MIIEHSSSDLMITQLAHGPSIRADIIRFVSKAVVSLGTESKVSRQQKDKSRSDPPALFSLVLTPLTKPIRFPEGSRSTRTKREEQQRRITQQARRESET
jgi:hypothetical protein